MINNNWKIIHNPTEEQTKEIRLNYLTSSNLKSLHSKNKDYYELIAIKKGLTEKQFNNVVKYKINTGLEQEPWILEWLQNNLDHPILVSFETKHVEACRIEIDKTNYKCRYVDEELKLASELDGELKFTLPDTYEFNLPFEIKTSEMSFTRNVETYIYQLHCNMRFLKANKILLIVANPRTKLIEMGWVNWDQDIWNDLAEKMKEFWIDFNRVVIQEPNQDLKDCITKYQLIQNNIKQLTEEKEQLEKILFSNPIMNKEFMIISTTIKKDMPKTSYIKEFIMKNKLPYEMFYESKNSKSNKIYFFGKEE